MRDQTKKDQQLPQGLRKFLTVTEPDGAPHTGQVERSALLNRMETFLPRLKAANEALDQEFTLTQSAVQVEKVVPTNDEKGKDDSHADEEGLRVNMDLYVDDSLGKLVGSATDAPENDDKEDSVRAPKKKKRPLIEVLSLPDAADCPKQSANKKYTSDNRQ